MEIVLVKEKETPGTWRFKENKTDRPMTIYLTKEQVKELGGQYVLGDIHTNTAEGFFSLLKRGIIGIYHFTSKKHLQRYLNEFSFRYNLRKEENGMGFTSLLCNCSGRLTYKGLIANAN